jgi:hypothetical protein
VNRYSFVLNLSLLLASFSLALGQPDSLWSRTFGEIHSDVCKSLLQTADGGFVLAGTIHSGVSSGDFWLVKTDENGDSLWSRTFGGTGSAGIVTDRCNSVLQTADGGYVLAGFSRTTPAVNRNDFWLVKTDENGDSLWSRTYGGDEYWDECWSVIETADGGYALAGCSYSFGSGGQDFWLVKTDADGDSLWSRTYGGSNDDKCYSVQQTSDGGYVLAGHSWSFGNGLTDFWIVKTDRNGDSLWSRTYGGAGWEECYSVHQTTDGGYILAGAGHSGDRVFTDFWLIKTDADGDSLWGHSYGGSGADICLSSQTTSDGGYVLAGYSLSFGGDREFWLVKTDAGGDSLWSKTFGGSSADVCFSVLQTTDGGFALAGYSYSFGNGSSDFWLVKTGPDPATDVPDRAAFAPTVVTLSAYPNPFNPITTIRFDLPFAARVVLDVYNIAGQKVASVADQPYAAGSHAIEFDGSALASGLYFARLQATGQTTTTKLMLVK